MCLIISLVFSYLSVMFYLEGNIMNALINGLIALFFIVLLVRNIIKTKKERDNREQ
jgi:hypothetical protein